MKVYPYWAILVWRLVRTGLAAGLGNILLLNMTIKPDWSNIHIVLSTLSAAFVSGFIAAFFLAVRDSLSGGDKSASIQKLPL